MFPGGDAALGAPEGKIRSSELKLQGGRFGLNIKKINMENSPKVKNLMALNKTTKEVICTQRLAVFRQHLDLSDLQWFFLSLFKKCIGFPDPS